MPDDADTGGQSGATGDGRTGVYAEFIAYGYCHYVAPDSADIIALGHKIPADLRASHRYHIIDAIPHVIEIPPIGQGTCVTRQYEPRS